MTTIFFVFLSFLCVQNIQADASNLQKFRFLRRIASSILPIAIMQMTPFNSPAHSLEYPVLQNAEQQTIALFEKVTPSVVYISTYVERLDAFSMNVFEVPAGTGSGFVWDMDGHIVTN